MNNDDRGQMGGKIDSESNKEEKMSIDYQQESRRNEDEDREATRQRLASVTTSQPKPELMNTERFWDHVNGGELDAHEVRKARQLEVDCLSKMRVFGASAVRGRESQDAERTHHGAMCGHTERQGNTQELTCGGRISPWIQV